MPHPAPPADGDGEAPRPPSRAQRAVGFALVLVLTLLLCVWAAFLVPLRVGTVRLPVALLIAGLGNVVLGRAAARLLGPRAVLAPLALWAALAALLGSRRREGDLVVLGDLVGTAFLLVGVLGFLVAFALGSADAHRTSPGPAGSR